MNETGNLVTNFFRMLAIWFSLDNLNILLRSLVTHLKKKEIIPKKLSFLEQKTACLKSSHENESFM